MKAIGYIYNMSKDDPIPTVTRQLAELDLRKLFEDHLDSLKDGNKNLISRLKGIRADNINETTNKQ